MFLLLSSSREDLAAVLEHESFTCEVRLFPLGGKREKGESFFDCTHISLLTVLDCLLRLFANPSRARLRVHFTLDGLVNRRYTE